jgi:DNA-binding CsgD family transcriptional regulator/tetratricopeptide (TPR) repeat protein
MELRERDDELAGLAAALAAARAGAGSVLLVSGEAGIGKSALLRRFLADRADDVHVLAGGCDDLLAPRALGPLREAAGADGPLAATLRAADHGAAPPEDVSSAVVAQLRAGPVSVLVVEDLHWADDSTLDVLRRLGRAMAQLPALLVLSVRDEALVPGTPVHELVGAIPRSSRLTLAPLSPAAVQALAGDRDGAAVHRLTRGNPFYVTEVLAAGPGALPDGVADAVQSRVRQLGAESVAAVEQLAVLPQVVEEPLARELLGPRYAALGPARAQGVVELRSGGLAFRHELARRAVVEGMAGLRRRELNLAVIQVLRRAQRPDAERLVHHAVAAGDIATIVEFAPRAGAAAAAAGSHSQALAHFAAALPHLERLSVAVQARLLADHAWELYIAHRFGDAVTVGRQAVARFEQLGEPEPLGEALTRLARLVYMAGDGQEALVLITRATAVLAGTGNHAVRAAAAVERGSMLMLTGDPSAESVLREALELVAGTGRADLEALALNYLALATSIGSGVGQAIATMRTGLELALSANSHEAAARVRVSIGELLGAIGDWPGLAENAAAGLAFAEQHGMQQYTVLLGVHLALYRIRDGAWAEAERLLAPLAARETGPNMLAPFVHAAYGRLHARQGLPDGGPLLEQAWRQALRQRQPTAMALAGRGLVEWAWLAGRPDVAEEVAATLLPLTEPRSWAIVRGELLRYLARAGLPAEPFPGCPAGFAAGIAGDWAGAAAAAAGDPYEHALELAFSGAPEEMVRGLELLDGLGARAAAARGRRELRRLGVRRPVLRGGRHIGTDLDPALAENLTDRQLDVLELLVDGASNARIATELGVSIRTVDHHVSAVLARLGVGNRRAAAALVRKRRYADQ